MDSNIEQEASPEIQKQEEPKFSPSFQGELESHPLFKFIEDPLLSPTILPINKLNSRPVVIDLTSAAKQFGQLIHEEFFLSKTIGELHSDFQKLSLMQKTLCGKLVKMDDVFFRCLDCEILMSSTSTTLFCTDCFEKSKPQHEGHRIIAHKNTSGAAVCDCGDADNVKPEGFCPDHTFQQVSVDELLQKFPKDILERFQSILKKAFYGVFALYEIARKCEDLPLTGDLLCFADLMVNEVFSFCIKCYTEIDISFVAILELVLKSSFQEPFNSLWHDCKDIKDETDPKGVDITQPRVCTCLLIENLLRLSNIMSPAQQMQLKKIYTECFNLSESKEFYHSMLLKFLPYMFSKPPHQTRAHLSSELLQSGAQFFEKEDLNLLVLDSDYFQQTLELQKKTMSSPSRTDAENAEVFSQIRAIWKPFLDPRRKTADRFVKQSSFFSDSLEVVMMFQTKYFYKSVIAVGVFEHNVLYDDLFHCFLSERALRELIEKGLEIVCSYPEEEKQSLMKNFLSKWYQNFQAAKAIVDEKHKQGVQSLNSVLERILGYALTTRFGNTISSSEVESLLEEALPNTKPGQVATQVIEGILRSLGIVRYLHLIQNYSRGKLYSQYYWMRYLYFEIDTSTIQIMSMLVPPEGLFQIMVQNYFSYSEELQNFFKDPKSLTKEDYVKHKITVLQDFLNLLIFIMNDEISFLNIQLQSWTFKQEDLDERSKQVLRKVVINLLLSSFWTDLNKVKNSARFILFSDRYVDALIPTLTTTDETGQKIRLKEEYISEFDPYLFHRIPVIQANTINTVSSRQKKDEPIDLISGKYDNNTPQHLKTIRKQFFQSDLPEFLSLFLRNIEPDTISLTRPVLKLILFNLQVAQECRKNSEDLRLEEKIEKNYMTAEFQEDLNKVLADPGLEDCKLCVQKIQGLLEKLKEKTEEVSELKIFEESKDDAKEEDKKKKAEERMQKMKEKFAKQRENFSKGNAEFIEATMAESPTIVDEQEKVCQICLGDVGQEDDPTEYGIPLSVIFTNNFYDRTQEVVFKEQDYSNVSETDWWPVISSCNHYYHKACFREVNKNSRKPQNTNIRNYSHPNETNCPMCTTLCNAFLCLNQNASSEQTENSDPSSQTTLYSSLGEDLKSLLKGKIDHLRKTIQVQAIEGETPVTLREIFWRAYFYYINSFSLHKSTRALQQQFNLYTKFFKVLLHEMNNQEKAPINRSSFLEKLYQKSIHLKSDETNLKITRLLEFKSESTLNEIFFDLLISFSSKSIPLEYSLLIDIHFQTPLREYLAFKTVQLACFEQGHNFQTIEDIISYYQTSQSFKDKVSSELLHPLQLAILPYTLHYSIILNDSSSLEKHGDLLLRSLSLSEHLSQLLQALGFNSSFEKLIETCLSSLLGKSSDNVLPLSQIIKLSPLASQSVFPKTIKYAPSVFELPQTFAEFNTKYFAHKCSLCKSFPRELFSYICLICGEVFCLVYCDRNKKDSANGNKHASRYHMGLGLFLGVYDLKKTAIGTPVNTWWVGQNVYVDKLGQGIQTFLPKWDELLQKDFKDFILSPGFVQYYKEVIFQHFQGKEAFQIVQNGLANLSAPGFL